MFPGSITTADGSALVKLGNTTVICGIKAVSLWTQNHFKNDPRHGVTEPFSPPSLNGYKISVLLYADYMVVVMSLTEIESVAYYKRKKLRIN